MNETIKEILKAIEESMKGDNRYFGIRGADVSFEIGTCLEDSLDWDYENDRQGEEKANGTCVTRIGYLWFDDEILHNFIIYLCALFNLKRYKKSEISVDIMHPMTYNVIRG